MDLVGRIMNRISESKEQAQLEMIKSLLPKLKPIVDAVNKPIDEGGIMNEGDFTVGFMLLSHNDAIHLYAVSLGVNTDANNQIFISNKVPFSALSKLKDHANSHAPVPATEYYEEE